MNNKINILCNIYIMLSIKKINNIVIKPIKEKGKETKIIKHKNFFDDRYPNIFISAGKGGGKGTLILNLIENLCVKRKNNFSTTIYLFSGTYENDEVYIKMFETCKKLKINITVFNDDDYKNIFDELLQTLNDRCKEYNENYKNKDNFIYPLGILIFDDINIRSNQIYELLRKNRHYRIINILGGQYYKDLDNKGRGNLNYLLIFNMNETQGEAIYNEQLGNYMSYDLFMKIFNDIKNENKYNFLYINTKNGELRINLNLEIIYKKNNL